MKIEILDAAEQDIATAIAFYESQAQGVGSYFLSSIFSDIESLRVYAGVHIVIEGYYRLLSKRFPFSIYYKINNSVIYIYAVLDCRKNPSWVQDRLKA